MKIRFLTDRVVQDEHAGTEKETRFHKGKVYDLPDVSAEHWLNRKVAERVTGGSEPTEQRPVSVSPAPAAGENVEVSTAPKKRRRKRG